MTADLIAFLRARLDDDERTAQAALELEKYSHGEFEISYKWARFSTVPHEDPRRVIVSSMFVDGSPDPARVLREVAAKRRLIEYAEGGTCGFSDNGGCLHCDYLDILAAVYADHPEYRAEWRA